ncbi:MAG: MmcQ/YjbR family DNA-binding protein [Bacteroidota bacterium]
MFALLDLSDDSKGISIKCNPELALELREQYPEVTPAYHFNKKHWNTINLNGSIHKELLTNWIDHSYELAFAKLTKKMQKEVKIHTQL